jgi:RNA polymerase sigma-70 factor (ECF subfamily)
VYSLVRRLVGREAEAEDVLVEVFWQVWQQAGQYDAGRGEVFTWVMMLARSRALDRQRRRQSAVVGPAWEAQPREGSEPARDPEEELMLGERRRQVRAALDRLPEGQRQALELAYYGGLTQSEIATVLNEPLGTIKTRIRSALIHLRESLSYFRVG